MASSKKTARTCPEGHRYFKSSDCPVCPVCEKNHKPGARFLLLLSAPARRALESNSIDSLKKLSAFTNKEILALHGMGPSSIPVLEKVLKESGLSFRD